MAENVTTTDTETVPDGLVPDLPFDIAQWGEEGAVRTPTDEERGLEDGYWEEAEKKGIEQHGPPVFPDWV